MKNQLITIYTGNIYDPAMEHMMQKTDAKLKELACYNAKHFAKRNLPSAQGDNLEHYTGDIKAGYEKLATDVFCHLQPAAHFPEAKMDADYFREKVVKIEAEIKEKEAQNRNDEYELNDFDQSSIPARIRWAVIGTLIITIGEVMFNTKAFQVTGENMLFALILSICISFAVFIFSHITPFLYKGAKNNLQRWTVVCGSLFLVTVLFTALAIFRSSYLAIHDVHINPSYFVIINLFFFIVSTLLSFFILPSWTEIKQNALRLKIFYAIKRRKREIEQLKKELEKIKVTILERTKLRIRIAHLANYASERIRKMYWEVMGAFKTTNLTYRTDGITPDCFSGMLPEPEIDNLSITILNTNS
jgi:cation transport ATPase